MNNDDVRARNMDPTYEAALLAALQQVLDGVDADPLPPRRSPEDDGELDPGARARRFYETCATDAFRRLAAQPGSLLRGFAAESIAGEATTEGWGHVRLLLSRGDERILLYLSRSGGGIPAFHKTKRLALTFADTTPLDTEDKRAVADLTLRAVDRVVAGRERAQTRRGPARA